MTKSKHFIPKATGPVEIPLTNDYLFRALLQRNNKVLKGLICSLLHLSPESVESVEIILFPDAPEFYATNMLMNVRNHKIYSGKFRLNVLDLTRTDLATYKDKKYHIDYWASLFKAATWEEINMLAQEDNMIKEASNTMYQLSQDRMVRLQCEAREDFYRLQRTKDKCIQDLTKSNAEKDAIIADQDAALSSAMSEIAKLKAKLEAAGIK
jgi:hypothetical protein